MSIEEKLLGAPAGGGGITPSDNFTTVTYSGNDGTNAITGVGFKPDLVWLKSRTSANSQNWTDSTRGAGELIFSNNTDAQYDATTKFTSFDADGFTVSGSDNYINNSSQTYVAWCWKANGGTTASNAEGSITSTVQANANAGFSIVEYTGNSTAGATVGHGLSAVPQMIIVKRLDLPVDNWPVYNETIGNTKRLALDEAGAAASGRLEWNNTTPTSTVITLGNHSAVNTSSSYIAYCFADIAGYSKVGSYTGNGSTNGPIIETGFEVGYVMIKCTSDSSTSWRIYDNKRNTTNPRNCYLKANANDEEECVADQVDFLSNGFQIVGTNTDINGNTRTQIYMAFATDPDTEVPTLLDSFSARTYIGTGTGLSVLGVGFQPNLLWIKQRSLPVRDNMVFDSVRGPGTNLDFIYTNHTSANNTGSANYVASLDSDGFTVGSETYTGGDEEEYISWNWKSNDDVPTGLGGPQRAVYKFEDNVTDVTGNFAATANSITYAAGKFNQAAVFNGSTGDIDLHGDIELTTMAVSLWVYLDNNAPTNEVIIEFDNGYGLNFPSAASGKLAAQWGNSNANHTLSNAALSDSQWYNVVANFRSGATDLYIDGVKQTTGGTAADYLTADENTIGSRRTGEFLDGMVDQVRIFPYNIGQTQVTELYNETTADNDDVSYGSKLMATASVNANAGFSIVQFMTPASPGADTRIPHGLSAVPEMIILKRTDGVEDWYVYHTSMGTGQFMRLNTDALEAGATDLFNTVNATVFNPSWTGTGDQEAIAYCFHSVTGYSKFGGYTGNGSATGPSVTTGFQPDFLLIKRRTTGLDDWILIDSLRGDDNYLCPDLDAAENGAPSGTVSPLVEFTSTGFEIKATWGAVNSNTDTYIYAAFRNNTTMNTTLAGSFNTVLYTGSGFSARPVSGLGFSPDLVWMKGRSQVDNQYWQDSVRTAPVRIYGNSSGTEYGPATARFTSFDSDGFTLGSDNSVNMSTETYVAWCWKAGQTWNSSSAGSISSIVSANTASGFSVVKWTGDGSASATVGHGLSSTPEFVLVKNLSTTRDWNAYHVSSGLSFGYFNLSDAFSTTNNAADSFDRTIPTSTVFSVSQTGSYGNRDGDEYITYCWHSVAGFSDFGGYTGTGVARSIAGLGFQPDYVMIKEADGIDSWEIYDNLRGAGQALYANGDNAEVTTGYLTSFDSDGFSLTGSTTVNETGKTYIYMSLKMNPEQFPISSGEMAFLTIAGGASGFYSTGAGGVGGGGAGGLRTSYGDISGGGSSAESQITLAAGTYTITVGAGGASSSGAGNDGVDSSITGLVSITSGGGGAGGGGNASGDAGGSGGGSGELNTGTILPGGAGTTNQGFNGGDTTLNYNGGGGGGAGSVGKENTADFSGDGGSGLTLAITGRSIGYAGGGGGAAYNAVGTIGGGSATQGGGLGTLVGVRTVAEAGTVNTGGGGGALGGSAGATGSTAGGSGIVILRMNTSDFSGTTSGSPTISAIGSETILQYLASGSYVHNPSTAAGTMNYMVLSGGASGGSNGGGGGSGGLRSSWYGSGGGAVGETPLTLSSGTYTITIGGGGAETTVYQNAGNNGTATTISGNATVNTVGGGGGGSNNNPALTGGSGGGSGSGSGGSTGAAGTAGEGFAGGNGMAASHPYTGAGGGGTGVVGGGASGSGPGAGGNGTTISVTGTAVSYGGGGGGTGGTGVGYTGPGGAGGTGGGGAGGAYNTTGIAGTANTGGGGGGSGDNVGVGGAGGSGKIILRLITSEYSGTTTGSPTVTTVGTETVLTFTGSGTYVHS